jgi:AcrR family transcriptional regulator
MNAAVTTLDEIGYINASLAQIARRAGISTALISYHFEDKLDLMNHTLMALLENATTFVQARIQLTDSNQARLHTFITASLEYQATYPERFNALLEIIFNARTPDNVPYYKLTDGEDEPLLLELQQILREGQKSGEFRQFNALVMANAIQGAIREYAGNTSLAAKITAAAYGQELVRLFDKTVLPITAK